MRQTRRIAVICVAIVAGAASFSVVRYANADPYNKEKSGTRLALGFLRGQIQRFHETTREFPSSLIQMQAYFTNATGERWGPHVERISHREGNGRESGVLDGTGGWCYNPETGELRVNLDQPLAHYFKYYYRLDRNERPCDW